MIFFPLSRCLLVTPIYWFAEIQTVREGGGDHASREVWAQGASKKREDNSDEEAFLVDIRQNCFVDSSEEITVEERLEGFQVVAVVDREGRGRWWTSRGERK